MASPERADRPVDLDRDRLKITFNQDAELYDRARPRYPAEVFDDLVEIAGLEANSSLLEVGCGTGRATLPLAQRGHRITCVELGENLAAVARKNLAPFPDVRIEVAPFERWDSGGETFDLVYAASAWHWIDPDVGYRKAADLLRPSGSLAIIGGGHAFPADFDPFFREIQKAYEAIGEDKIHHWPLPEEVPDLRDEIEATGLFGEFESRRYVWELMYTAEEYIDLLNTFSGHIAQEPEKGEYLYEHVRELINARADPRVRRHWLAILNVARKL
jgi:SAM-dependent methyltransferase